MLIAKRPSHLDQGGLWEFPGGKREPGESNAQALVRELHEELDVMADLALPMMQITHEYSEKIVTLDFFEIPKWHGDPAGKEGQLISWVAKNQLEEYTFPAANNIVLRALKLSRIVLVTPIVDDPIKFSDGLEQCLATSKIAVQLTRPDLSIAQYRSLSQSIYELCEKYCARLILDTSPEILPEIWSDLPNAGLHLNNARLIECTERPITKGRTLTAACHNLDELEQAELLDVDAAILTPIKAIKGPRALMALGWREAAEICDRATIPVFAHGGLQANDFPQAVVTGCYGMALDCSYAELGESMNLGELIGRAHISLPSVD